MNLLNRKVFITDSAWICLVDSDHSDHEMMKALFKNILNQNYRIITSSYVIDNTLELLKKNYTKEKASEFLDIIERAVMGNYLKVYWLTRRLRQKAIDSFLLNDFASMTRAANIEIIKAKKVHSVLTLNPKLYTDFNIPVFHLD